MLVYGRRQETMRDVQERASPISGTFFTHTSFEATSFSFSLCWSPLNQKSSVQLGQAVVLNNRSMLSYSVLENGWRQLARRHIPRTADFIETRFSSRYNNGFRNNRFIITLEIVQHQRLPAAKVQLSVVQCTIKTNIIIILSILLSSPSTIIGYIRLRRFHIQTYWSSVQAITKTL